MTGYLIGRLVALIPVVVVVGVVAFVVVRIAPGDPAGAMLGMEASDADIAAMRQQLGLDRSIPEQFVRWLALVATGNLGESIFYHKPVLVVLQERLQPTLMLGVLAEVVALVIGIPIGILSAVRRGSWADQGPMVIALLGVSVPEFWLALNMIILFGVQLGWLPTTGYVPLQVAPIDSLRYLVMPAFALGIVHSALIARMTRSAVLEVLSQDYVRTARSKGLRGGTVIRRHVLKNAGVPVLTVIGLSIAGLAGGAAVIETIFGIPGVGQAVVNSVARRDYPMIQGVLLMVALANVLINLAVDLSYTLVDPRIRYS